MVIVPVLAAMVKCYVGCNSGAPDGQTMHVLECDTETGAASIVQTVKELQGTTYFAFDREARNLYSYIGETVDGRKRGSLVRFAVEDGRIGEMTRLAALPCETPCHIALSPDGKTVGFAAYTSATAGTMPAAGGGVKSVVHSNEGTGPNRKRQKKAYAHCAFFTPDGSRMGIIDLGTDRINFYEPATMKPLPEMTIHADPGDGPRHAVWSNDGRFLFVVNELGNTVFSFAFDGNRFSRVGKWRMLPYGVSDDASKASAIKLTADGRILMASNRGHDSIAFFAVDAECGTLTLRNIAKLTGSFPRDFELMPGERFMVVGHKMSNEIQVYRFDRAACTLEPVGRPIPCWRPLCFKFRPQAGDQDTVRLETSRAAVEVSLHGGRVLSFAVGGDEVLWRPRAWRLEGERWAHGGIPLCWPWFGSSGPDPKVMHGFARSLKFSVRGKTLGPDRCELVLGLSSDAGTRSRWPHDFDLEYRIVLTDRLRLELKTTNTGSRPFQLTAGFHPYFAIGDRDRTVVTGTDGMRFCDSRETTEYSSVWRGDMPLTSSFDHVFVEPHDTAFHAIEDPVRKRRIGVSSSGAARLVVWNPGVEEPAEKDPAPGGLAVGDWRNLICVEPAILWKDAARTVAPGGTHLLSAEISSAAL